MHTTEPVASSQVPLAAYVTTVAPSQVGARPTVHGFGSHPDSTQASAIGSQDLPSAAQLVSVKVA